MAGQLQKDRKNVSEIDVMDVRIPMFDVVFYNDDYTTFEFVSDVLIQVFYKSEDEAERITMMVHQRGKGVAGTYPREIAEMKVSQVHKMAAAAGFPLRAGIEESSRG